MIKSNDKKRALEAMRSLLAGVDYDGKDQDAVGRPDPPVAGNRA